MRAAIDRYVVAFCIVGFALFLLLTTFILWNGPSAILFSASPETMTLSQYSSIRSGCFCATFFSIALLSNHLARKRMLAVSVVTALLLLFGSVSSFLASIFFIQASILLILSAAAIGLGGALSFMIWLQISSQFGLRTAGLIIIGATILSGPLYLIGVGIPDFVVPYVVMGVVIPLSSFFLIFCVLKYTSNSKQELHVESPESFYKTFVPLWRPILSVCVIGFVSGVVRMIALTDESASQVVNDISTIAMAFSAAVLIILWNKYWEKLELTKIYQIIFPLVATGFLVLPFLGQQYQYFFAGLSYLAFSIVSMLMMLTCIKQSCGSGKHLRYLYGIFAGCVYAFVSIGSEIGSIVSNTEDFRFTSLFVLALVCVYLLGIVYFAIRGRQHSQANDSTPEIIVIETNKNLIPKQCCKVAEKYGLSKRECEIAELLAKGRDVPYISEALYISKNTVRTHSKNLYRKLDIHNRQELLDRLEEVLPSHQ